MTDDTMALRGLLENSSDAELLLEMSGFAAERLMALEVTRPPKPPRSTTPTPRHGARSVLAAESVATTASSRPDHLQPSTRPKDGEINAWRRIPTARHIPRAELQGRVLIPEWDPQRRGLLSGS